VIAARQLGAMAPAGGHAVAEVFMLHSLGYPVFANPPLWSLYVEVIFYLVAPLFLIANPRQAVAAATIGLVVFSIADAAGPASSNCGSTFVWACWQASSSGRGARV